MPLTRRAITGMIAGSFAAIAFGELRPATATSPRTCGSKTPCPKGCACKHGTCRGKTKKTACYAAHYNYAVVYNCQPPVAPTLQDCTRIASFQKREACNRNRRNKENVYQRSLNRYNTCLVSLHSAAVSYAVTVCA